MPDKPLEFPDEHLCEASDSTAGGYKLANFEVAFVEPPTSPQQLQKERVKLQFQEFDAKRAGVYFLYKEDTLVYIGQSSDCVRRVFDHVTSNKDFDSYAVIPIPKGRKERRLIERAAIKYYDPPLNRTSIQRPIGLEYAGLIFQYLGEEVLRGLSGLHDHPRTL